MCGISGILNLYSTAPKQDREVLHKMANQLQYRGPDGQGFYMDDHLGLAHTRLSIIDLSSGDQPIHNEDKSVWVIFNGEIFNFIELRALLEQKGHHFYTKSDTEIIVHLYEERGPSFVEELNGQFAIALWDQKAHKLLLLRDRPGIAPLFYTVDNGRLIFASEIKAILPALGSAPRLSVQALDQLMTFWAPASPNTIFEGIWEVPPGEMLVAENGSITSQKYWNWTFPEDNVYRPEKEETLAAELHDLLKDATQIRLRSDVPVGAYLSGGLDSSVLTALIHHYGGVPLRTFSVGFEDESLDETSYQDELIRHLEADHSRVKCTRKDIGEAFLSTIWHTETPILRTAPVPMRMLSKLVRDQNYKVVLTGEGADEILGGYDLFKEAKIRQFWAKHPASTFRPLLLKRLYPYLDVSPGRAQAYLQSFFGQGLDTPEHPYFSHLPRFITTAKCKEFFSSDIKAQLSADIYDSLNTLLPAGYNRWHPFNRSQYLEVKTLMAGYLLSSQGDRMLLGNSVEGRFPFLDHRVMAFSSKLHPRLKMKVLCEKYLLKKAGGKYLPDRIVKRYKQPYRAPDIPSFFGAGIPDYVQELLSDAKIAEYGYFDPARVALLKRKIEKGRAIGYKDNMSLVGILSTQVWHHHFVDKYAYNFKTGK